VSDRAFAILALLFLGLVFWAGALAGAIWPELPFLVLRV
jgi:hypothetical protein